MKFSFFKKKKEKKHEAHAEEKKEIKEPEPVKDLKKNTHEKESKKEKIHTEKVAEIKSDETKKIEPEQKKNEFKLKILKTNMTTEKTSAKDKEINSVDLNPLNLAPLTSPNIKETQNKKFKSLFGFSKKNSENKTAPKKIHADEKITQAEADAHKKYYKKKKKEKRRIAKIFDEALEKSGYEIRGDEYKKKVKRTSVMMGIISSLILLVGLGLTASPVYIIILFLFAALAACSALFYIIFLIGSFIFLDYIIYQRTKEIEEVLPEFLQLASANISAGMPIDRALWFAVRPKFGILAKEIEEVAKATMAGEDLEEALEVFTRKYDSRILKESMNLLIEGMRAGGEIGFLLNQIASNMQDIKIMKKEISASVMSYVIFITIAAIVGAPFLLALSAQLLVIMGSISSSVQMEDSGTSSSTFKIDMSGDSISIHDFKIFAIVVLLFSSIFSAMIISVIRKGNTNESIKIIPGYIFVSLLIFFAASALFGGLLGSFF